MEPPSDGAVLRSAQGGIVAQGYDLSLNRYKEVVHEEVAHRPPGRFWSRSGLGGGDSAGNEELEGMLK